MGNSIEATIDEHVSLGVEIMKYFRYAHLPERLQSVSENFAQLAIYICTAVPSSAERTVALRKLLESKDAAVRAAL